MQLTKNQLDLSVTHLIDEVISNCQNNTIDFFNTGEIESEKAYIKAMRDYYCICIKQILDLYPNSETRKNIKVLEIGSFYGIVAIVLKKLGFDVTAQDIPEFNGNHNMQKRYEFHEIHYDCLNLGDVVQPYADSQFDLVIMCEVIEHLNFNPLPILQEITRILKKGACLYITTPNQVALSKRFSLLFGKSICPPIEQFVWQSLGNTTMIIGIHWREYTKSELHELMSKVGLDISKHSFHKFNFAQNPNILRAYILKYIYKLFPDLLPMQSLIATKL